MKLTCINIIMVFLFANTCNYQKRKALNIKYDQYSNDSSIIAHIIKSWIQQEEISWFEYSRYYSKDSSASKPIIFVDTILYNEDKSRLFSIIILQRDTSTIEGLRNEPYYENYKGKYIWDARSVLGFKDSTTGKWQVYPWMPLVQQGFMSKEDLSESTRNFYFNEVKNRSAYAYQKNNELISLDYDYNVNDSNFWKKSFIWQKGLAKKGFYNFQLDGIVKDKKPELLKSVDSFYRRR